MTRTQGLVAAVAASAVALGLGAMAPVDARAGHRAVPHVGSRAAAAVDGRIAFTDYGAGVLTTVNPDGSALVQVTDPATDGLVINRPTWMPNGQRLVYTASRDGGPFTLYSIREDGTGRHVLVPNHGDFFDFSPAVTSDARWVYFDRCRPDPPGGCGILRARTTGRPRVQTVVDFPPPRKDFGVGFFALSPNGRRLAFTRVGFRGIINQIWVGRADGTGAHPVTRPAQELTVTSWSSQGRLVVNAPNAHPMNSVFLMRPDGRGSTLVARPPAPHSDFFGAAAPSGSQVAFVSDVDFPDISGTHVYVANADGSGLTLMDAGVDTVGAPAWGTAPLQPATRATPRAERAPALAPSQRRALTTRIPTYLRHAVVR